MSHTTIAALIGPGDVPEPLPETTAPLWAWLDSSDRQVPGKRSTAGAPVAPPGMTLVSDFMLGRILGVLETTVAWVGTAETQMGAAAQSAHAVGGTLEALREMLMRANAGVSGLLTDGTIPRPAEDDLNDVPPEDRETFRRIYAAVERERARERAEQAAAAPPAKQAGGG